MTTVERSCRCGAHRAWQAPRPWMAGMVEGMARRVGWAEAGDGWLCPSCVRELVAAALEPEAVAGALRAAGLARREIVAVMRALGMPASEQGVEAMTKEAG